MLPPPSGLVISKEKLIALANVRKYHARKRSLADINTRKSLHLGLSHLKTQREVVRTVSPLALSGLPVQGKQALRVVQGGKSQTNSVERIPQWSEWERKATSTSVLPIAVLKLVPTKPYPRPIHLPKILREVKERRETQPVPIDPFLPEETKEGPFSLVSFAEQPLVFLEDRTKRLPMPSLGRGRLKSLLSFPQTELQDYSLLGVFPCRRTGANWL